MPQENCRILILTRRRDDASFRLRVEQFLPYLADRGIECESAELAAGVCSRQRQLRQAADFDGLWLHRKTLTMCDALMMIGRRCRRLIYDVDDAVMFQSRTAHRGPNRGRMRRFRRTLKLAHLSIVGNEYLATFAPPSAAGRVEVVPTGLDVSRYMVRGDAGDTDNRANGKVRLVWIGSRSTLNQVRQFAEMLTGVGREIPGVSLRIIADDKLEVPGLEVENLPWSAATEARLLSESDIGIAPLPDTPFTRGKCAFKVLQYMAAGLPVVTSPVGANARYVKDGLTGLHADGNDQWIAALRRLCDDAALRRRMGLEGRRRVEREFDTSVIGPRVAGLIAAALDR